MITDDELIRLLELADPALVDDPAPVLAPAEYRDALNGLTIGVTLIDNETAPTKLTSGRRWPFLVAAAAVVVAIAVVVAREDDDVAPADQPSPTVTVPPTTPPRPMPRAQGELDAGTYYVDEVEGTPVPRIFATIGAGWFGSSEPEGLFIHRSDTGSMTFDRPVVVYSDACHPSDGNYPGLVSDLDGLVAALTVQRGWGEVTDPTDISIDGYAGKAFQRTAPADMSDCDRRANSPRRFVANDGLPGWPDFRSWEGSDGGDGGGGGGSYYEPGGIETVWVLDLDGTLVVISTNLWSLTAAAADADFAEAVLDSIHIDPWSPELTARPLEVPNACRPLCPTLAVSPDGTLVALDENGKTLTWYDDEPRAVSLTKELGPNILLAIGPHDIAYIMTPGVFVAVAPSGAEITRRGWPSNKTVYPTATGLVSGFTPEQSSPNALLMPWVDLDGNPITDTTPYPTWTATDAGIEIRLGERKWLLTESTGTGPGSEPLFFVDLRPRSDGGVVTVLGTVGKNVFELLPDGTTERYFVANTWPMTLLRDGSLIVEHDRQLIRLTPPAA